MIKKVLSSGIKPFLLSRNIINSFVLQNINKPGIAKPMTFLWLWHRNNSRPGKP